MQSLEGGGPDSGVEIRLTDEHRPAYWLPRPARHCEATRACVWRRSPERPSVREKRVSTPDHRCFGDGLSFPFSAGDDDQTIRNLP